MRLRLIIYFIYVNSMLIVYYTVVTLNYKIISVSCFGVLFSGTIRGLLYAKGFKELI